jgi:hypothetical protein
VIIASLLRDFSNEMASPAGSFIPVTAAENIQPSVLVNVEDSGRLKPGVGVDYVRFEGHRFRSSAVACNRTLRLCRMEEKQGEKSR